MPFFEKVNIATRSFQFPSPSISGPLFFLFQETESEREMRELRDLQLSLNQTQKVRLQRALQQLQDVSSKANASASVTVADTIPVNHEDGVLKYPKLNPSFPSCSIHLKSNFYFVFFNSKTISVWLD